MTEFLSEEFGGALPGLHLFIYGVVMIFVVFYMPKGIYEHITRFFRRLESRLFCWNKGEKSIGKGEK